jgi:hypothetical protein
MRLALFLLGASILFAASPSVPQNNSDLQLPELQKIKRATLSPSYSCRPKEESRNGYQATALYLSRHSRDRNEPELLFNCACGSEDTFDVQMAGDAFDVITDYGDIPLASMTAQQAFSPTQRVDAPAKFSRDAVVHVGHTYGVLMNKSDERGLFFFRVVAHVPNKKVDLEYVVLDYQILQRVAQSPGFSWDHPITY